ncbi:MAG: hypothetical protein HZB09_00535 [Candidatus Yonathbacteria bacterium]|nr:hypothetical protein [Candidatus Yonathbacteria bacterium]
MDYTKEQIKERFGNLPKDIQQELSSSDLGLIIQIIGSDVGITPEQSLDVEDEALDVLMGFSHPKDFIRNIRTKIGVDENKARTIAEKVNDEIFQPVKESLKIVHDIKDERETPVAASIMPSFAPKMAPVPMPPVAPTPPVAPSSFPQMIVPPKAIMETIVPKPVAPVSQNIFEQKLQGVFKMPKEETLVPQRPSSPTTPTPPRPSGIDPYREPAA